MANLFNSVRGLHPRKNAFNKSYRNTFTTSMGKLVPVFLQDCVPGTTIRCGASGLIRFQALLAPIMDNVNCYVHFWKIPYRLLDADFPKWIGNELADEEYDPPYITGYQLSDKASTLSDANIWQVGGLLDFLGYPSGLSDNRNLKLNIRPIQAYALLLKCWYTNENFAAASLIDAVDALLDAHGEASQQVIDFFVVLENLGCQNQLFNHAWAKDYFTSALPSVQAGDPVTLGIGGSAPVTIPAGQGGGLIDTKNGIQVTGPGDAIATGDNVNITAMQAGMQGVTGPLQYSNLDGSKTGKIQRINGQIISEMKGTADLSDATAVTINELRVANALQVFKERLMRYGHRYVEYLRGFFNVTSSDARLQLPEWLGGGKMPINIADIEQTSATSNSAVSGANTPQGNLAGKGTGFSGGFAGFKTYCEEECIVIGLMYVQPKASYCQGVSRFLTKLNDRYDYFNPSFEHLGEQEIKNYELYADEFSGSNPSLETFGYTPRYAEYRFHNDETHGQFKSTLNFWTLTRIFAGEPALNPKFIYTQPESLRRIFAVEKVGEDDIDNLLCDFYFNLQVVQPVSKFGTPMLLN